MDKFSEWDIENFSCWSNDLHGDLLRINLTSNFQFYPRGVGGKYEHLVVRMAKESILEDSLLSFIGSDGSVICTRQPAVDSDNDWVNFTGPKFEEIVAGIRRNEPLHKDRLTLRLKIAKKYLSHQLHTVIEARSQFFQMKPEIFDSNSGRLTIEIDMDLKVEGIKKLCLKACKTGSTLKDTKVKFTLESPAESKFISQTSIWMAKGDNIIKKYDDYRIVEMGEHILFPDIPFSELFEEGFQTIMRCKIISGRLKYYRFHSNYLLPAHITDFSWISVRNALENTSSAISSLSREPSSSPIRPELKPAKAVSVLLKDLESLYQDQEFADFEIYCGTVCFPTHKNILSARSPVLKAMLSGDMREAACGNMEVEDLDPHTLGRFLAFLYSGATGEEALQWEEAYKLYYAADKYQVPSLKEECSAVLRDSIALENVCDILSLADKYQDEELRLVAHELILENFNEISGSENWEKLMMSDPLLVAKTLTNFAKNNKVKKVIPTN